MQKSKRLFGKAFIPDSKVSITSAFLIGILFSSVMPVAAQVGSNTAPATTVGINISNIISALLLEGCNIPDFSDERCAEVIQTQEQVNQFTSTTLIEGNLIISGQGDLDFTPFNNVREITGNLKIIYGKQSRLIGFNRLESVASIEISNNSRLTVIGGFDTLTEFRNPSGFLWIEDNQNLTQISGFRDLQATDSLLINRNPQLETISRFDGLISIEKNLDIFENPKLQAINGFSNLRRIGNTSGTSFRGSLIIRDNEQLSRINGFGNLESVRAFFSIRRNPQVNSMTGFGSLQSVGSMLISFMNLPTLPSFSSLQSAGNNLQLRSLPALSQLPTFSTLTEVQKIDLVDLDLVTGINSFNNITALRQGVSIIGNAGLTQISGFGQVSQVGFSGFASLPTFTINDNLELTTVDGFDNLTSADVTGLIYVVNNRRLDCPLQLAAMEPVDLSFDNLVSCEEE